jgi:hypothetical protein
VRSSFEDQDVGFGERLSGQAGLADAGLAADQDQRAPSGAGRRRGARQRGALLLAADQPAVVY